MKALIIDLIFSILSLSHCSESSAQFMLVEGPSTNSELTKQQLSVEISNVCRRKKAIFLFCCTPQSFQDYCHWGCVP